MEDQQESEELCLSCHQAEEGDLKAGKWKQLREAEEFSVGFPCLPRGPYRIGVKPWILRVRQMTVEKKLCLGASQISAVNQRGNKYRYKRRVLVVGALLLRGTECPVCQPD